MMIVQRITVHCKPGKVNEAIALVKAEIATSNFPHAVRMYTPQVDTSNSTINEYEFENVAELEQFWAKWETRPETSIFHEKYGLLIELPMVVEIFDLH
jgi:hypothetical protein